MEYKKTPHVSKLLNNMFVFKIRRFLYILKFNTPWYYKNKIDFCIFLIVGRQF
jgi:homogentisate 1,2-dioxygenase